MHIRHDFFTLIIIIIVNQNDLEIGIVEDDVRQQRTDQLEKMLSSKTGISRSIQELLGSYITLERYFLTESVSKAVAMDTTLDASALTSSIVDDVFFLVKKSIRYARLSYRILKANSGSRPIMI